MAERTLAATGELECGGVGASAVWFHGEKELGSDILSRILNAAPFPRKSYPAVVDGDKQQLVTELLDQLHEHRDIAIVRDDAEAHQIVLRVQAGLVAVLLAGFIQGTLQNVDLGDVLAARGGSRAGRRHFQWGSLETAGARCEKRGEQELGKFQGGKLVTMLYHNVLARSFRKLFGCESRGS